MSNWKGGRNSYQDQSGEYALSAGYTFERTVFRSTVSDYNRGPAFQATAKLRLDTPRRHFGVRVEFSYCDSLAVLPWGPCKSLRDAQQRADAALASRDWVRELSIRFYSRQPHELSLLDGTPFITMFCEDYFYLPSGEYIARSEQRRPRRVSCYGSGYSSRTEDSPPLRVPYQEATG